MESLPPQDHGSYSPSWEFCTTSWCFHSTLNIAYRLRVLLPLFAHNTNLHGVRNLPRQIEQNCWQNTVFMVAACALCAALFLAVNFSNPGTDAPIKLHYKILKNFCRGL